MKAITLTQPWASLVACGAKQVETRSWRTNHRGPLAIHAAASARPADDYRWYTWGFGDVIRARTGIKTPDELPRGVILCVVDLVDCDTTWEIGRHLRRYTEDDPCPPGEPNEYLYGNYGPGRYAWRLANVRELAVPLPVRGSLGLWNLGGVCQVCGCTDDCACEDGCSWVTGDLCSACVSSVGRAA